MVYFCYSDLTQCDMATKRSVILGGIHPINENSIKQEVCGLHIARSQ